MTEPTITNNKTIDSTGVGNFVSNITGLSPNTNYYVRAYGTNGSGTGYGTGMTFTTQPTGLPVIYTANVTETQFFDHPNYYSGGTIISDGGLPVTERGVCWSTNEFPTILDSKIESGTGVGSFSCQIGFDAPLVPNYVRAYATNDLGTAYGNQISFTVPCVPIWNCSLGIFLSLPVDKAVEQSIDPTLTWSILCIGAVSSGPLSFDVYLDTNPIPTTRIATNISSTSLILSNLDFSTTYYWRIFGRAINNGCVSAYSTIRSFKTVSGKDRF